MACHEAGELEQAEALYREVLRGEPDDLDALNLLGLTLQARGDVEGSIELLSRAVRLDPDFAEALTNLARAQCAAGDAEAAAANASRAAELDPELAEAPLQLGRALLGLGQDAAAAEAFRRTTALAPGSADAHRYLGLVLTRLWDDRAAISAYEAAISLEPDHAASLHQLAMAYLRSGGLDQAVARARRAVALAPDDPEYCEGLARALRENQQIDEADAMCRRAIELAPRRAGSWALQGRIFETLGRFDAAEQSYRHALEIDPDMSDAFAGLAGLRRLDAHEAGAVRLRSVLADPRERVPDRVAAGMGLGGVLDRAGDYDSAFASFAAATALARGVLAADGRGFDPSALARLVNWLIDTFGREAFQATAGLGNPSKLPVFIVGMPRSGTTLVEQIAASHPRVFGAGERKDIAAIGNRLEDRYPDQPPMAWDRAMVRQEADAHIQHLLSLSGGGAERVIDKMPDNVLLLGVIAVLFPGARVIMCRRDLRDVCLSCFFQSFSDGMTWSYDLAECAARASEIERLSQHWMATLPLRMLQVRYEALVADVEGESRRLIDFLGLEWDPRCLDFHQTERSVKTASAWQVRQPVYGSSVGRWRHYERHIGPLLEGLAGLVPPGHDWNGRDTPNRLLALAQSHRTAGRPAAAEAVCRALLTEHPDHPDALCQLAQLLCDRRNFAQAMPLLARAVSVRPDDPAVLTELGQVQRALGDAKSAVETAARAVAIDANLAAAHLLLGFARLDMGDGSGAVEALQHATALVPGSFDAWLNLATGYMRLKDYQPAADAFTTALELNAEHVETLAKLAYALNQLGRYEEALAHASRAVELAPDDPRPQHALVLTLWNANDTNATLAASRRAIELDPSQVDMWVYLGRCEAALGHFETAADHYRHAITVDPTYQDAQLGLSTLHLADEVSDTERLDAVLRDPTGDIRQRAVAGFTLCGKLDQKAQYDQAFAAAVEANRLMLEILPAASLPFEVEPLRRIFSPGAFAATKGWGDPTELPVFIVGLPRSGTTLVEQIAASHPQVFGAGERRYIDPIVRELELGQDYRPPRDWNPLTVRRAAAQHAVRLRELGGDARRVVDKMPDNVRFLGHISVLFPNARIIVCRRDLRDVGLSCFMQPFSEEISWTSDLTDIVTRFRETERLIALWREVLPRPMLEMQDQLLVANPEAESRRLIEFLGLEWDPACLAFHETQRPVLTASFWQVRQPVYGSSVGRWRHYRKDLGPLLEGLAGYLPVEPAGA